MQAAAEVGLDAGRHRRRARQRSRTSKQIEQEAQSAKTAGIEGVPCFIFDGKFAVSGAQAPEYLAAAIERIASGEVDAAE